MVTTLSAVKIIPDSHPEIMFFKEVFFFASTKTGTGTNKCFGIGGKGGGGCFEFNTTKIETNYLSLQKYEVINPIEPMTH